MVNDTAGQGLDQIYTDWFALSYARTYASEGDRLLFGGDASGSIKYAVTGFTTASVELYDVTDPAQPIQLTGFTAAPEAGLGNVLRFGDNRPSARRYLALALAQRRAPLPTEITLDTPSDLLTPAEGADYILISHADFLSAMQPLAAHRSAQGMRVAVVDVQDVYDQFGYGMVSAEAIRDFLAYAYANWPGDRPTHVTLVGDGTYDLRRYLDTSGVTYLPPYLEKVDPVDGETAADNRFVTVSGGDSLPDMHVGRLPANTAQQAADMVNKIIAYEGVSADADWVKRVLFVADDLEQGGGNFYQLSDAIADGYDPVFKGLKLLPGPYTADKVYLGQTCDQSNPTTSVECRQQIAQRMNAGSLLVSFIGHATKQAWALEKLYDLTALSGLTNTGKLPVLLPMTCYEGYFHEAAATFESLSEAGVRKAGVGAVASWAPTGQGLATGHDYLERGLFLALLGDRLPTLGAATTEGKLYLAAYAAPGQYADLLDTYLLMGDSALHVPTQAVSSIGDRVWSDANGNGVQDAGEGNLASVRVYIDSNGNNAYDASEPTATTDSSGIYTIGNLAAGTYDVRVDASTLPANYVQTYDLNGGLDHEASAVVLAIGQDRTDVDFGYQKRSSIGDRVWNDANGNGVQDAGEGNLASVRVYIDSNGNNAYNAGEPTATTNGSGIYTIGNLAAGTYDVRVDINTLPANYVQTYDLNGGLDHEASAVVLAIGQDRTDVDFGYRQRSGAKVFLPLVVR